jgi:hypothetical protein
LCSQRSILFLPTDDVDQKSLHGMQVEVLNWSSGATNMGIPYFSISASLNVLTLKIATWQGDLNAVGPLTRPSRLYHAIVIVLIESCTLYTIIFMLFNGGWATNNPLSSKFSPRPKFVL